MGATSRMGKSPLNLKIWIVGPYKPQNPKPQTLNPKPQTLNPKPRTLNPKPQTLNPKPWQDDYPAAGYAAPSGGVVVAEAPDANIVKTRTYVPWIMGLGFRV